MSLCGFRRRKYSGKYEKARTNQYFPLNVSTSNCVVLDYEGNHRAYLLFSLNNYCVKQRSIFLNISKLGDEHGYRKQETLDSIKPVETIIEDLFSWTNGEMDYLQLTPSPLDFEPKMADEQEVVKHRIPFHSLTRMTVLSVLSKMDYKSFTNTRTSTKWLHSFIEENRKYIHLNVSIRSLSISRKGIRDVYVLKMPLCELKVLRPKELLMYDFKFNKIPRLVKVLCELEWFSGCSFYLSGLEEKTTMRFLDEIFCNGYCLDGLTISSNGFFTSNNISRHPLLPSLRTIILSGCPNPDIDFILGSQTTIKIRSCKELPHTAVINRLMHSVFNGSSNVEHFFIHYNHYRHDPFDEIMAGIPYKLLWSRSTHKKSIFTRRRLHPLNSHCNSACYWVVSLINGKVLGIRTAFYTHSMGGNFHFMLFNSEEELINALVETAFRPY